MSVHPADLVLDALGYQYGEDDREGVRLGWELARNAGNTAPLISLVYSEPG